MKRSFAFVLFVLVLLTAGRVYAQSCSGVGSCPIGQQCFGVGANAQCWMPVVNCEGDDEETCVLETMTQENFDDLAGPLLLAFVVAAGFRFIRVQILNRR